MYKRARDIERLMKLLVVCSSLVGAFSLAHSYTLDLTEWNIANKPRGKWIESGETVRIKMLATVEDSPVVKVNILRNGARPLSYTYSYPIQSKGDTSIFEFGGFDSEEKIELQVLKNNHLIFQHQLEVRRGRISLRGGVIHGSFARKKSFGNRYALFLSGRLFRWSWGGILRDLPLALNFDVGATFEEDAVFIGGIGIEFAQSLDIFFARTFFEKEGEPERGYGWGASVDMRIFKHAINMLSQGLSSLK